MSRKLFRSASLLVASLALAAAATACSSTTSPAAPSSDTSDGPGPITATGEGISLNDWGGQALALGEPRQGGSVKASLTSGVLSMDMCQNTSFDTKQVGLLVYDTLMTTTKDGTVKPELAESMTTDDGGRTWTMKLPSGLRFTDGTPFNADAVVANTLRCKEAGQSTLATLTKVTAVDDTTVRFELSKPWTSFDGVFATAGGSSGAPGMVVSPAAVEKWGDKIGLHPVGVGPFVVKSFKPGGEIVLTANRDYRIKGQPYLDEITLLPMSESDARLAAVRSGDIDFTLSQVADDITKAEQAGLRTLRQPAVTYYDIVMNLSKPPFDDPRFRKAVTQAIDLDGLSKAVFGGVAKPMSGLVPSDSPSYVDTGWPKFDLEAAKQTVAELVKEGKQTSFTLTSTAPPEFQKQAQIIQQMLKAAGIEMKIDVAQQPAMISAVESGSFEAQLRYTSVPADPIQIFSNAYGSSSPANLTKSGNPAFDELIAQAKEVVPDKRQDLIAQMQHELTKWQPIIPLLQQTVAFVTGDRIAGFGGAIPQTQWWDGRTVWVK